MDLLNKVNRNEIIYQNSRVILGPIPKYWTKVHVRTANQYSSIKDITNWVSENLNGPWTFYSYYKTEINKKKRSEIRHFVCLAFEDPQDKFMFEMMGGYDIK